MLKDKIKINQLNKTQKLKSQLTLTFETSDSSYELKTNLIKGVYCKKIIKQNSTKMVKNTLAFIKEKKQAIRANFLNFV
jgi:hypothetical protein